MSRSKTEPGIADNKFSELFSLGFLILLPLALLLLAFVVLISIVEWPVSWAVPATAATISGVFFVSAIASIVSRLDAALSEAKTLNSKLLALRTLANQSSNWLKLLNDQPTNWYWEQDKNFCFTAFEGAAAISRGIVGPGYIGKAIWDLNSSNVTPAQWNEIRATLREGKPFKGIELKIEMPDESRPVWITLQGTPMSQGTGGYCGTGAIITKQKIAEEELQCVALSDRLTTLHNRAFFLSRLPAAISAAKRHDYQDAVFNIDIDNFKSINEQHGFLVGDQLLRQVSDRIKANIRASDTAARMDADEFAVLFENISGQNRQAEVNAQAMQKKLTEILGKPYDINGLEIKCAASVAYALSEPLGDTANKLLSKANKALHERKAAALFLVPKVQEGSQRAA